MATVGMLVLSLTGLGLMIMMAASFSGDRATAERFSAAPPCAASRAPATATATATATEDCLSWRTIRVVSVSTGSGATHVQLQDVSELDYTAEPDGIARLAAGEDVQVLFWRGNAQGIKAPGGPIAFADDTAATRPTEDVGFLLLGLCLLLFGAVLPAGALLARRGADHSRVVSTQCSAAALGLVALAEAAGVLSDGASGAVTAFEVVAGFSLFIALLVAYGRLRRRR
ncbi:hypothetical protein [Actinospica robiniae]|uniref:hypothetical protein n=1 Tax=Actinospica robiniae TaxID=304901 RepID=UPI0012F70B01|nr:hypothetical protein [Actinospica robiniae]